jgi:Leucine-rich repeat (LRR) protein
VNQKIKYLERGNFKHQGTLQELHLNNNQIENLPEDAFSDLRNLKQLILSYNKIEQLPEKIFKNLKNIERIDLRYNRIHVFSVNLVASNLKLEIFLTEENPANSSNIDIRRIPTVKCSLR